MLVGGAGLVLAMYLAVATIICIFRSRRETCYNGRMVSALNAHIIQIFDALIFFWQVTFRLRLGKKYGVPHFRDPYLLVM